MTDLTGKFTEFCEMITMKDPAFPSSYRKLSGDDICILENSGSLSRDWSRVFVTGETDLSLIQGCTFAGEVYIHLPSGELSGTRIEDCRINGPVEVVSTGLIKGMTLCPGCTVNYCGRVVWTGAPGFLRTSMQPGLETGERAVPILPNLNHIEISRMACADGRLEAERVALLLKELSGSITGFLGPGCSVVSCPHLENTLLIEDAAIHGATAVIGSLLMPGSKASDGALVRNSVLQWNSSVDSLAVVQDSIVGECSQVEMHGKLLSSFLGADSVLGEGEVTASLVGPLTGMHHQSLLIAAMWPGGKGNIGYGANIGSNHTSRLPDQEIRPGTGLFFGLSTSVKFPSDFSRSPYSVIATGITTLPQKVEFPFSLICLPSNRPAYVPEGWCRLIPGWMLHSNLYSVLRNLWKYSSRKSAVNTPVETDIFSDELLEMVSDALQRLERTTGNTVEGSGKNFITTEDIQAGIQVYRKCLRTFSLLEKLKSGSMSPGEALELLDLSSQVQKSAEESRCKDLIRGQRIIDDYAQIHTGIENDPFLLVLEEKAEALRASLKAINENPVN